MSFNRESLPDPIAYFEGQGLKLSKRGKWRSAECTFHGGRDSLRINTASGAWVCMAGCGARGGDVLAYQMAAHGQEFVEAAKALGAWTEDGKPIPNRKPTPLTSRQALEVLAVECNLVAVAAANVAHGCALSATDLKRLLAAAGRILKVVEGFA